MSKKLSTQHSKFCLLMAGGNINQTMAYMECYPDSKYETARDSASKLHAKPDIEDEINRVKGLTESSKVMSRTFKREILKEDVEDPKVKAMDRHRAIDIDNRMTGHYEPDLVEHNIKITWGEGK